jgi:hypothetical protein
MHLQDEQEIKLLNLWRTTYRAFMAMHTDPEHMWQFMTRTGMPFTQVGF